MRTIKILSFLLAALMVFTCFVACGGTEETESDVVETGSETGKETENSNLDAYGRDSVEEEKLRLIAAFEVFG